MRDVDAQQAFARVTVATDALVLMAARTKARIDPRFQAVAREKAGRVKLGAARLVEAKVLRQGGDVSGVALRALALGVAAGAEIARTGSVHAVTLGEILPVHDMARRSRALRFDPDVTR